MSKEQMDLYSVFYAIDNVFTGKHNSAATIGIFDFLLDKTTVFNKFDTLFLSGDSGGVVFVNMRRYIIIRHCIKSIKKEFKWNS